MHITIQHIVSSGLIYIVLLELQSCIQYGIIFDKLVEIKLHLAKRNAELNIQINNHTHKLFHCIWISVMHCFGRPFSDPYMFDRCCFGWPSVIQIFFIDIHCSFNLFCDITMQIEIKLIHNSNNLATMLELWRFKWHVLHNVDTFYCLSTQQGQVKPIMHNRTGSSLFCVRACHLIKSTMPWPKGNLSHCQLYSMKQY